MSASVALSRDELRLWYATQFRGGVPSYNIPFRIPLQLALNTEAFELAVNAVIARHPALRMAIDTSGEEPRKRATAQLTGMLEHHDFSQAVDAATWLDALRRDVAEHRFDLETGPILRTALVKLGDAKWEFLFCVHHIAFDAESKNLFIRELADAYAHFSSNGPGLPLLPEEDAVDIDFLGECDSAAYWHDKLADAPALLTLPVSLTRAADADFKGIYVSSRIALEHLKPLRALGREKGVTESVLLKALCDVLLFHFGVSDTIIGMPISKRVGLPSDVLISYQVRVSLLRSCLTAETKFADLLVHVQSDFLDCIDRGPVDIDALLREVCPVQEVAFDPYSQVLFSHVRAEPTHSFAGEIVAAPFLEPAHTKCDIELAFIEMDDELVFRTHGRSDLFEQSTLEDIHNALPRLLSALIANPHAPLNTIAESQDAEKMQEAPSEPVHLVTQIDAQMLAHPSAIALIGQGRATTYKDLAAQVEALAQTLRIHASPGVVLGLCMRPSALAVATLLAGWRVGVVFCAIDYAVAGTKLRRKIGQLESGIVVADTDYHALFDTMNVTIIDPGQINASGADFASTDVPLLSLCNIAAIVNGLSDPDGEPVSHGSLADLLERSREACFRKDDAKLALTAPLLSGMGLLQMVAALASGGTLLLGDAEQDLTLASDHGLFFEWMAPAEQLFLWSQRPAWRAVSHSVRLMGTRAAGSQLRVHFSELGLIEVPHLLLDTRGLWPVQVGAEEVPRVAWFRVLSDTGAQVGEGGYGRLLMQRSIWREGIPTFEWVETGWRAQRRGSHGAVIVGALTDTWGPQACPRNGADLESILESHPGILIAREHPTGDGRVMCITARTDSDTPSETEAMAHLSARVASYLLPNFIVLSDAALVRTDGTVDPATLEGLVHNSLQSDPLPSRSDGASGLEAAIASLWESILGTPVGLDTNFFEAGGDSLRLLRLNQAMNVRFDQKFKLMDLFRYSTVRKMTTLLRQMESAVTGSASPTEMAPRAKRVIARRPHIQRS